MKLINIFDSPGKEAKDFILYGTANCKRIDISCENMDSTIRKMTGSFAIIRETEQKVTLICDFIRSIPIFYCICKDNIIIGNNGVTVAQYCRAEFDEISKKELLYTSYVTGNRTLFKGVYVVLPGEVVTISKLNGDVERHFYWEMLYGENVKSISIDEMIGEFDNCLVDVFKDLIGRLDGRTALLPLSGGCDSRIIAVMLKRLNYKNVLCFSYGRRGNDDADVSRKTAKTLGFPWYFVEYTKDIWKSLYTSEIYRAYLAYSCNGSGIGSIRSFPAMLELKTKVPADSIIIPGHTLDVSLGSHIPDWKKEQIISKKEIVEYIKKRHYRFRRHADSCAPAIAEWSTALPEYMDRPRAIRELQYFEWINRQPKFIANDVRKYEFLGYEGWDLPFWDYRVCDFARSLPPHMLVSRYFQYKYMKKVIDPFVNIHINYFGALSEKNIKRKLSKNFPLTVKAYHCLKIYKHDDMAFYEHMNLYEYVKWIGKCGTSFNIHAMTAEDGLHRIVEIMEKS